MRPSGSPYERAHRAFVQRLTALASALCVAFCSLDSGAEGSPISAAPSLRTLAANGEIPVVAERVPADPFIVTAPGAVGAYGGALRCVHLAAGPSYPLPCLAGESLLAYEPGTGEIIPHLCRAFHLSTDRRSLTIELRPGLKWSDGTPCTTADFSFWFHDVASNRELNPVFPPWLVRGGEPAQLSVVDDMTLRFRFAEPYAAVADFLAGSSVPAPCLPKHYLAQYHKTYAEHTALQEMTEGRTGSNWTDGFRLKSDAASNPDCPTLCAWTAVDTVHAPVRRWVRNPYYWKVDVAGNQLPYIDTVVSRPAADMFGAVRLAAGGSVDLLVHWLAAMGDRAAAAYTVLAANSVTGGYRMADRKGCQVNQYSILMNYRHDDSVVRTLLNDLRFRMALSHALDREQLNSFCMAGRGMPSQLAPFAVAGANARELAGLHTACDPERANALLDELLPNWDDRHRYRLRTDGKPLVLTLKATRQCVMGCELIAEHWRQVGIRTVVVPLRHEGWRAAVRNARFDLAVSNSIGSVVPTLFGPDAAFIAHDRSTYCRLAQYFGDEGIGSGARPDWYSRMLSAAGEILGMPPGNERTVLAEKLQRIAAENLVVIGGVIAPHEFNAAAVSLRLSAASERAGDGERGHPASLFWLGKE